MTMITYIKSPKEALLKLHGVENSVKRGEVYEVYGLTDIEIEILDLCEASANHIIKLRNSSKDNEEKDYYNKMYGLWSLKHRTFRDAGAIIIFKKKKQTLQLF